MDLVNVSLTKRPCDLVLYSDLLKFLSLLYQKQTTDR